MPSTAQQLALVALLLAQILHCDQFEVLRFVGAQEEVLGPFLQDRAIATTATDVYAVSDDGDLYTSSIDPDNGFHFSSLHVTDSGLTAASTSRNNDETVVAMTAKDGQLYRLSKGTVSSVQLSAFQLNAVVQNDAYYYVGVGQARLAINDQYLFLTALNVGEIAWEIDKETLEITRAFGTTGLIPLTTMIFSLATGEMVTYVQNPPNLPGDIGAASVYVKGDLLFVTTPGGLGQGVFICQLSALSLGEDLAPPVFVQSIYANTVARSGDLLIVGKENGVIDLFQLDPVAGTFEFRKAVNLKILAGFTGPVDIEVRALAVEKGCIFAGSSGGNEASPPDLPSLFTLEFLEGTCSF